MQNAHPSARVLELMRAGAKQILGVEGAMRDQLQDAIIDTFDTRNDPAAEIAIRHYNMLSVTHWASAILKNPEKRVAPFVDAAIRQQIREQIRRGTPETVLNGYRAAQIIAWRAWMHVAFGLTTDKPELEALLDFSAGQIEAFSQGCVELLARIIEEERIEHASRSPDQQYEAAIAILSGRAADPQKMRHKLGYRLDQTHQAMVIWSNRPEVDEDELETIVDRIDAIAADARSLRVRGKTNAFWLWLPKPAAVGTLEPLVQDGISIAVGRLAGGLSGFIETHESALITQQVMIKMKRRDSVVSYDQIKLADLMLRHADFSKLAIDTLGRLFHAPEDIQESLRVYLAEGANAAQAAKVLRLHRNTLNRHLERANDLLPQPLNAKSRLQVGAVLDALYWS